MSPSAHMTNGAASAAGERQSRYTLASHTNKKATLEHTEPLKSRTAVNKNAAMDLATPTSSPLASASTRPPTSPKINESELNLGTKLPALEQIMLEPAGRKVAVSLLKTTPDAPSVTALEMSVDREAEHLKKRAREEDDVEKNPRSKLKRSVKEGDVKVAQSAPAETEALDEATVETDVSIVVDGELSSADEPAESKKPVRKPKPTKNAVPKKQVAKPRRTPACAECKRRKVRCTHNLVEESPAGEGDTTTYSTPNGIVEPKGKPKKATKADKTDVVAQVDVANNDDEPYAEKKSHPKKPTAKPSRAPPERTSTRTRKAPERLESLQEQPAPRASSPRKGTSRVFDPIYITTNSTSRLGRADMYHMLLEDSAWTSLSAEQQATLVSMLPDSADNQRLLEKIRDGEGDTRPQWLKASDVFRDEVAKFKDDLTNGHLAKTWQAAAEQAVVERAAGEYDAWKAEEAESWWGQKGK